MTAAKQLPPSPLSHFPFTTIMEVMADWRPDMAAPTLTLHAPTSRPVHAPWGSADFGQSPAANAVFEVTWPRASVRPMPASAQFRFEVLISSHVLIASRINFPTPTAECATEAMSAVHL